MLNFTIKQTIKDNLCMNCGICKTVCKFDAITMIKNKYSELTPVINEEKCKNCGACFRYCPQAKNKLEQVSKEVTSINLAHTYGLQNASYYVAWIPDTEQRLKCCSGGATTKLACYLLEQGKIDGMIHTERLWGNYGDLHYGAKLSTTAKEICENVSSSYQPIDFSNVLSSLKKGKTYFMTGTPCVIRGIKNLLRNNPDFKEINIITCALICSHNVNSKFVDFFAKMHNIDNSESWKVNLRAKDENIINADNFKNHIYTKEKDLLNINRFKSGWVQIWRAYYFAMNSCLYCPDFWGYEADISVKDAWGKWSQEDNKGKTLVITRNNELKEALLNSCVEYEELDFEIMKDHQKQTPFFKQTCSIAKFKEPFYSKRNRKSRFCAYYINSKCSKFLYKYFGFKISYNLMKIISFITKLVRFI